MANLSSAPFLREAILNGFVRYDPSTGFFVLPDGGSLVDRQLSSPASGATAQMTNNNKDGILLLTPAGTIAALTVNLPDDAVSRIGQVRRIFTSQNITALTLQGFPGNAAQTIFNNITTMAAGDAVAFVKVAANMWARQK